MQDGIHGHWGKMMHQVTSGGNDYCMSGLSEDCQHSASHFDLCTQANKFYPSSNPALQLSLSNLHPLPQGLHKPVACQIQDTPNDFQPQTVRNRSTVAPGPDGPKKKKTTGIVKSGRRGRPAGTTKLAGYRTSTGRPLGTTKAAGFKTSPGRPLGTTRAAGYKVSPGRPPGSIKSLARLKKLQYGSCEGAKKLDFSNSTILNCSGSKKLDYTSCDVTPPFPYNMMQKRDLCEPSNKVEGNNE